MQGFLDLIIQNPSPITLSNIIIWVIQLRHAEKNVLYLDIKAGKPVTKKKRKKKDHLEELGGFHIHAHPGTTAPLPATAFSPNFSTYHFRPQRAWGSIFVTALTTKITGKGSDTSSLPAAHAAGTNQGARRSGGAIPIEDVETEIGRAENGATAVPARAKPIHSSHSKT